MSEVPALVDLGFGVTATREPDLSEVARAVERAVTGLEDRISDAVRLGWAREDIETEAFELAGLRRALKLVRAVEPHEAAVQKCIAAERRRIVQDAERKKENARYWAQKRQSERAEAAQGA